MKDEQQLHGASPELSLCHIAVKSDFRKKKKEGDAEWKVNVSRQERT